MWTAPGANVLGAPTKDGRLLSCVDPSTGDLALLDVTSGKLRRLTSKPRGSKEHAYFSVPSPDGRRVAYAWMNDAGFYDLRVAGLDGAPPRVVFRNEEAGFVQPSAWTPDGDHILTLLFRKDNISQIAFVDAMDGQVRVLRSLNWVYPKKMDISPDGKWIVYDSFSREGPGPRDIYLLAADGSRETLLVSHPREDLFPAWSPDGKEIVFASDRSGAMDAWSVRVSDGAAQGSPRLVQRNLRQFLPLGVTRSGDLFYGIRTGSTDIVVQQGEDKPRILPTRTPGVNFAPAWSRDGKKLAYLSLAGAENFGVQARVIVVRDFESGSEHDLPAKLAHAESVRWSGDGQWLLVSGSDGKGRAGIFCVRVKDGLVRPVVFDEAADYRGLPGDWNRGRVVYANAAGLWERRPEDGQETPMSKEPVEALAVSHNGKVAVAAKGKVAVLGENGPRWLVESVQWLEWDGERLVAGGAGKAWELSVSGRRELQWKDYDGGPFSLHPDGRTLAYAMGRSRHEVWMMEHVFAPVDPSR